MRLDKSRLLHQLRSGHWLPPSYQSHTLVVQLLNRLLGLPNSLGTLLGLLLKDLGLLLLIRYVQLSLGRLGTHIPCVGLGVSYPSQILLLVPISWDSISDR